MFGFRRSGNFDQSEYMRGMANAFLIAWNVIAEPYGKEVVFFEAPVAGQNKGQE